MSALPAVVVHSVDQGNYQAELHFTKSALTGTRLSTSSLEMMSYNVFTDGSENQLGIWMFKG